MKQGFTNVGILNGGLESWKKAGYPVIEARRAQAG